MPLSAMVNRTWDRLLDYLIDRLCAPGSVVYGNCYLAVLLYMRRGGYLIITRSLGHALIPHVAWAPMLPRTEVLHLKPVHRYRGWRAIVNSPFFKGQWVTQKIGKRSRNAGSE